MILVAGGTGRLGSSVVTDLLAKGHNVRVLTRGKRTPPPGTTGAEWVAGSVCDSAVVARAMAGVDVVVSAVTGFPSTSPVRVDGEAAAVLAEAAQRAGARLVLVSVAGASKDSHMELFRAKYAAEQELVQFDLDWTIIRSDAFADLWIELLTQSAGRTHRPVVFGPGNNPMGWVAVRDVSAATVSVAETTSLRRRTLTISGPQRLTLTELASHVMAAHDWPGNPRHVPTPILRFASMLPGAPGRQTSAALAMNTLPPVVDDAREAVPHLPSTPVQALLELARAEHP